MTYIALVLLFASSGARAEEAQAAPEDAASRAKVAYQAGKLHYDVGEFDAALERFSEAYKLRPAPGLLLNIGQCHRQLERHDRAAFFFQGFLREAPADDPNRALVTDLLLEVREALEQEQQGDASTPPAAEPASEPDEAVPAEPAVAAFTEGPPPDSLAEADEGGGLWLWGAAGAAALAVTTGAAVVLGVVLSSQAGEPPQGTLGVIDLRGGA